MKTHHYLLLTIGVAAVSYFAYRQFYPRDKREMDAKYLHMNYKNLVLTITNADIDELKIIENTWYDNRSHPNYLDIRNRIYKRHQQLIKG